MTPATTSSAPPIVGRDAELRPGYRVLGLLSRNQALDVYDVWSEARGVRCIAKVVRPDRAHQERVLERLRNEARVLLAFTHPNIVRAYELIEHPEPALVLETLSGLTLETLVATARRRLSVNDLAHLTAQLGAALAYVHRHGVVHLDIKPENIIAQGGQAKLIDFSLARSPGPVAPGLGTREYRAPEQSRGGHADERTDIWGLGATLFEAASGELPTRPRPPLRTVRRLPGRLADLIDACLDPTPEQRPSVSDLLTVAYGLVDVAPAATAYA
jgi:serine/threonine protein kinase